MVSTPASVLEKRYTELKADALALDLTRGKPSPQQLDLSNALLALPGQGADGEPDYRDESKADLRNYGGSDGLPELREIFAELLAVPATALLAVSNASLELMYNTIVTALLHGVVSVGGHGSASRPRSPELAAATGGPWRDVDGLAFICPVPGYDRHFSICEALGIRMIPVPFIEGRLDLETIRALVATDSSIRGMWAVPMYANPTGTSFTLEEAQQLVSMPTAAPDFRLFWDNAYAVHHLSDDEPTPIDILAEAAAAGHPDRVFIFASTSKITFPGAGVSFFASSPANVSWRQQHTAAQTIGPDKLNQLRHLRLFGNTEGVRALMRAHRAIIEPRFTLVLEILQRRLSSVATWTTPLGGYFISLEVPPGIASRAVALAGEIGVAVTPAGSSFPYRLDPEDTNIRLAPTFPTLDQLKTAIDALCTCILLAIERESRT